MFVESYRKVMVRLKKGAAKRIRDCQEQGLCLACKRPLNEKRGRIIRGVHESCRRLLGKHYSDLTECVAEGKILEPKPGRGPSSPVTLEALGHE